MPTQLFEMLNRFIGWGDRGARLWFVGIEEGGGNVTDPATIQADHRYRDGHGYFEQGELQGMSKVKIYVEYSKIACGAFNLDESDWERFYYERLGQEGGGTFVTNIFPVPIRSTDEPWPPHYNDLFGFGSREEYYDYVRITTDRFQRLKPTFDETVIVCNGMTYAADFGKVFGVSDWQTYSTFRHSRDFRVFLLTHRARPCSDSFEVGRFILENNPRVTLGGWR